MSNTPELCFWCDEPTERAGASDDSIYIGPQEIGPWCPKCWGQIYDFVRDEVLAEVVAGEETDAVTELAARIEGKS